MSQEYIIQYCAPTLAGIKIGSLFSYRYQEEETLRRQVAQHNRMLGPKGIVFQILRAGDGTALIYVFRIKQLMAHLQREDVRQFLREQGYTSFSIAACLALLRDHLTAEDFPHEIGVFLGYPLGDIRGFMEHKGANAKCTGCWKVYTDEVTAQRTFAQYKRCTHSYYQHHLSGTDITQLTVAG